MVFKLRQIGFPIRSSDNFIPNIENHEVKALFEDAILIFKTHEAYAEMMDCGGAGKVWRMNSLGATTGLIVTAIAATIAVHLPPEAQATKERRVVVEIRGFKFVHGHCASHRRVEC